MIVHKNMPPSQLTWKFKLPFSSIDGTSFKIFMWNSWFDISPHKWHQKWRHKKLRSIVKKAQMTTSLYQSVYFWQLGCRDFISYCFGLAKFKLNSLNLIFSRVFLHWLCVCICTCRSWAFFPSSMRVKKICNMICWITPIIIIKARQPKW